MSKKEFFPPRPATNPANQDMSKAGKGWTGYVILTFLTPDLQSAYTK